MALLDSLKDLIPQNTNIFGATLPAYLQGEGVASKDQIQTAKNQSLFQGLLGTALGYLAQPKNQGYGSAIPYLAKSYMQGMQMAQNPYDRLQQDVLMKEKFDQIARDKKQREDLQKLQSNLYTTIPEQTIVQSNYQPIVKMGTDGTAQVAPSFKPYEATEEVIPEQKILNKNALMDYLAKYPDKAGAYATALSQFEKLNQPTQSRVLTDKEIASGFYGNLDKNAVWQISPTGSISKVQDAENPINYGTEANIAAVTRGYKTFNDAPNNIQQEIAKELRLNAKQIAALQGGISEWGTAATNDIEKGILSMSENKMKLNQIEQSYDPEFLTMQGKFRAGFANILDRWDTLTDPEEIKYLERYTEFSQGAYDQLNTYIKEITGAALSQAEAERIMEAIPNPAKDGPKKFKAGLDRAIKKVKMAEARLMYLKKIGAKSVDEVPLSTFTGMVSAKKDEILEKALLNKQFNPQGVNTLEQLPPEKQKQLKQHIKSIIANEFGLPL